MTLITLSARNIRFSGNKASDSGGALYVATESPTHLFGCTFTQNQCDGEGGAIYIKEQYVYMEDCTVSANASGKTGGGILVKGSRSLDIFGRTVIRNNDGTGSMDNLVLEDSAKVYDQGLKEGSEIWLRSKKNSDIELTSGENKHLVSAYQLENYFHADYGNLQLSREANRDTYLSASAFSDGSYFGVAGIIIGAGAIAAGCIILIRRKGRRSCEK